MARARTLFTCQQCGAQAPRWLGRCPECGAWNSLVEEVLEPLSRGPGGGPARGAGVPRPITEVSLEAWERVSSGMGELDRVLGGGMVPGSLVLIGGDPGIGKSTLLMQASARLAQGAGRVLYVTAEESAQQVKLRGARLGTLAPELYVFAETDVEVIEAQARALQPAFLALDSIQAVHDPSLGSAAGTVSQVRGGCARLARLARGAGVTVFIVGHVTKEGMLAGPRVLEHMVDVVLYFEGDRFQSYRVLRGVKNRFGSTDEIGLFEMSDAGLREVAGASEMLLSGRCGSGQAPGSAVAAVIEGTRPLLVEVQALVARSYLNAPRRTTTGVDYNRAAMILAVLERRCGMRFGDKDVFVNVAGGLKVVEPALDLAMAAALAGSFRDRCVDAGLVLAGEVGLGGEVRAVSGMDRRLREGARMGFTRALVPASVAASYSEEGMKLIAAASVREAIDAALTEGPGTPRAGEDPFAENGGK